MLTILLVVPELDTGGVERATIDVARAVVASGGRAFVATRGGRMEDELRAAHVTIIHGPFHSKNPWTIYRNAARLAAIIRTHQVGIIHAQSRAPAWSALWAARRTGAKFMTTFAGIHNARTALKRWYNSIMASGDVVIANSAYTAEHIRSTYPGHAKDIVVIPRGIDLSRFGQSHINPQAVAQLRQTWGVPPDARVVLMPGRLTRWKGPLVFIEAMAALSTPHTFGILAGDSQSRDAFQDEVAQRIRALNLTDRVRHVGHIEAMPIAYAAADVVVSASIEPEAFGRIAVEAQAMGRPVIATALGAAHETVLDGRTGWLIPPSDAAAMAAAIDRALACDPHARAAMSTQAQAHIRTHFAVEAMCAATLQLYRRVLAQS